MKCQHCDRPATFHITELTGSKPLELHLCEEHARQYLSEASETGPSPNFASSFAQSVSKEFALQQTAGELQDIDSQVCDVCGIKFYEFRKKGRLGCPHDYVSFDEQLQPLIVSIHGESVHVGKRSNRFSAEQHETQSQLVRFRRELDEAVAKEDYEQASRLRDTIQKLTHPF